ncbi:PTHB1 C-terminus-domain-containing protein [Dunaliella salina]|nr:PTHB1 C-terminus-domain-containing protein [Dunaliella salina]|eukprot:KAF5831159.1 PTHB1 C-terminus-domain-containing protein [Dunaliella salina]
MARCLILCKGCLSCPVVLAHGLAEAHLPGGPENLLVASHNHGLHVYRTTMLCWAARTLTQPIALRVADFITADDSEAGGGPGKHLRGMLVMLDESGLLSVCYLGTDAMANSLGWGEGKEVDYEDMMREQKQLAAIIQAHSTGQELQMPDRMVMRAQVPRLCDHARAGAANTAGDLGNGDQDEEENGERMPPARKRWGSASSNRLTTKLYLYYQGGGSMVDNVSLVVRPPKPLKVDQENIQLRTVGADPERPTTLSLVFSLQAPPPSSEPPLPSSSTAQLAATFEAPGTSGQPRGQHLDMVLPLSLFTTLVPPVKNAVFKLTVSVNRPPPLLSTIFDDMLASLPLGVPQASVSGPGANVLSFQFASGHDVTVLVSKNAGRYRLQSDTLEAMWMVMSELVRRLMLYYEEAEATNAAPEGPLAVTFEEPLPLDDFFEVVEAHFAARLRTRDLREQLGKQAMLFRTIQKQLLIKFRDKAPAALNDLDVLMEETYQAISSTSTEMEAAQEELRTSSQRLACVVQLILLLIQYKFQLQPEEVALLQAALSPEVHDNEDIGWEETTEASMTQLLRSCLARNAKEASVAPSPLTPARDTSRLRKHISLVLERLAKGMRLTGTGPEATASQ